MSEYFIESKSVDELFPSLIFKSKINDTSICDTLYDHIMFMWKNQNGYYSSEDKFISYDNLNDLEEFKILSDIILSESENILNFFKVKRDSHYITTMWANVSRKDNTHNKHIHPNSFLSGTFYISTPDGCGPIVFSDPRPAAEMIQPDYIERDVFNCGRYTIVPKKGDLLFWQSWFPHSVERSSKENQNPRISIAFNIMIKGQAKQLTQRYLF